MTGGTKTDQAAIQEVIEQISSGNVQASELLPYVGALMSDRAQGKINVMRKSSIAEHARFQNIRDDKIQEFGSKGGEEGLARIWWAVSEAIRETSNEMEFLGTAWNRVSKAIATVVLIPQSIRRMFEGRDSTVQRWLENLLGEDRVSTFLESIRATFTETTTSIEDFKTTIKSFYDSLTMDDGRTIFGDFFDRSIASTLAFVDTLSNSLDLLTYQFGGSESKAAAKERIQGRVDRGYNPSNPLEAAIMGGMGLRGEDGEERGYLGFAKDFASGYRNRILNNTPQAFFYEKAVSPVLESVKGKFEEVVEDNARHVSMRRQERWNKEYNIPATIFNPLNTITHTPLVSSKTFNKTEWDNATDSEREVLLNTVGSIVKSRYSSEVDVEGYLEGFKRDSTERLSLDSLLRYIYVNEPLENKIDPKERVNSITSKYLKDVMEKIRPRDSDESLDEVIQGVESRGGVYAPVSMQSPQVSIYLEGVANSEENAKMIGDVLVEQMQGWIDSSSLPYRSRSLA